MRWYSSSELEPSKKSIYTKFGTPSKFRDILAFALVTCFGVLHHIPNVSFVMSELGRVLEPGGVMLLREPVISMGDWRKPRRGLTKRERGIPLHLLQRIAVESGFEVIKQSLCMFPTTPRLFR